MSSSRLGTKDLENCNPNRSERIQALGTYIKLKKKRNISTSCHHRAWEPKTSKIAILTGANESRLLERPKSPEPANELTEGDSSAGTPVTEAHSFQRDL
ncbi:hypothetical protein Glove_212g185 [Diversispora epigaea]|uniref:Uncharacterized protein n=1 Tax=Diversispora epigaea TaxID=1348612 RepID=A0A397IP93_9GLOM|nr:hypothetical protein Glove_212g185 [Diversispora epigaea]